MFYQWAPLHTPPTSASYGRLDAPSDINKRLHLGESLKDDFPENASLKMRDEYPDDVLEIDRPRTLTSHIVVSEKLRDFLLDQNIADLEFLNVQTFDHSGKPTKTNYSILNPIRIIDCIDQEASDFEWNSLDSKEISTMYEIAFNDNNVSDNDLIIRPRYMQYLIFVRAELAQTITEARFTGVRFREPGV